jgi:hypothetical protein
MKKSNALAVFLALVFILSIAILSCSKKDGSGGSGNSPKISSITPSSVLTGAAITIAGKNLSNSSVQIGGISSQVTDNSATAISTVVPAGASTGEQEVVVENSSGKAKSKITVTGAGAPPVITSITPAEVATGANITIHGTGLGNATVEIYKKLATVTAYSNTSITATVPTGIPSGQAAVDVTTALGHVVSSVIIK